MDGLERISALLTNYLAQVTAYQGKKYNPAALAQYNELVIHINALAAVGIILEDNYPAHDIWDHIVNSPQVKYANPALLAVFNANEADWVDAYPVDLATA